MPRPTTAGLAVPFPALQVSVFIVTTATIASLFINSPPLWVLLRFFIPPVIDTPEPRSSISSRFTHNVNASVSSITSVTSLSTVGGPMVSSSDGLPSSRQYWRLQTGNYGMGNSRKEGYPTLLLSASPALTLHASHALLNLRGPSNNQLPSYEASAHAQFRALIYAAAASVRTPSIFSCPLLPLLACEPSLLASPQEGQKNHPWLFYTRHAAMLSERKGARRRAALWYLSAADKLEKTGIKPLAMHFFRKAHDLYQSPPQKDVSPSFWESEAKNPTDWRGFEAVLPGIEHELGRLLYTTGDTEGAVRYFLGLLRPSSSPQLPPHVAAIIANGNVSPSPPQASTDKVYMEDFRVAFKHFRATEGDRWKAANLKLPATFCRAKQTRVRFPGDAVEGESTEWDKRECDWSNFWSSRGKEKLEKSGKAAVDEAFWIDLVLRNPLDVEVTLSGLTVRVKDTSSEDPDSIAEFVEVEVIDDIILGARDTRTIPVSARCTKPASLVITHVMYNFLSLLPTVESLAVRGRRLHDTPHQRQNTIYAPDVLINVEVEEAGQRLHAHFIDDRHLVLAQGEHKRQQLWLTNSGMRSIGELWVLAGEDDEIWVDIDQDSTADSSEPPSILPSTSEVLHSSNSLAPQIPFLIPLEAVHGSPSLGPGEEVQIPIILHAAHSSEQGLCILFVFREAGASSFHCARVTRRYEVRPIIRVAASSQPSQSSDHSFIINVEVENVSSSSNVVLSQISALSAVWICAPLAETTIDTIPPHQIHRLSLGANACADSSCSSDMGDSMISVHTPAIRHFIHSGRRNLTARSTTLAHPDIPPHLHRSIFPLYNPSSVDVLVFWELPTQGRSGHILISGLTLGAHHAALKEVVEAAENAKVKRSMYAETRRERAAILEAVRDCEWNAEMDPVGIAVQGDVTIEHDFSKGPCHAPVIFTLRNYSLTHPSRIVLKLSANLPDSTRTSDLLQPQYTGRLTHRRILAPSELLTIPAKLWITRPGCYALEDGV
ncbi:hypothetical protein A0H81_00967 [Grifola frondosa]|uniref:TPPC8 first Ig-like domain-containing protein n=1 Tax=Grifola frondosa TaxID=5627 RepID=A0A1C7MR27_GRIFR|nr:hypothetical protein A0H81_00967 [Grifola frondosa]